MFTTVVGMGLTFETQLIIKEKKKKSRSAISVHFIRLVFNSLKNVKLLKWVETAVGECWRKVRNYSVFGCFPFSCNENLLLICTDLLQ